MHPLPSNPKTRRSRAMVGLLPLAGLLLSFDASAANGKLSSLTVANLSPAFDPNVTQYTIPNNGSCGIPVKATVVDPTAKTQFYIANNPAKSGVKVNAWICNANKKFDLVIYENWQEKGRYTISMVQAPPPPPPPPPISGKLTALNVANLSPAFDPNVTQYTIPQPANCSTPVTASVSAQDAANPNLKLYVSSNPTSSGGTVNAWLCDGKTSVDVVIYDVWNEVGHYTITSTGQVAQGGGGSNGGGGSDPGNGGNGGSNPSIPASEATPTPSPAPTAPALPGQMTPVTKQSAVRFLGHASFGPTPASIAKVQAEGFDYWMAEQANLPESTVPDSNNVSDVVNQQFANMANGADQLRQRMIFALSQIIVVSSNKNIYGPELKPYVQLLSKHAFGNYRALLRDMTISPSMGKYLDLANSLKATASTSPNENYARELMQLFSIGLKQLNMDGSVQLDGQGKPIATYDQNTLREIARALTGWTYPTEPGKTAQNTNWEYFVGLMEPRPANHDTGSKTVLNGQVIPAGQSVTQDMESVIDNIFNHPNVPPFVAMRLIEHFVTSNPSPSYVERVAQVFVNNGQNVRGDLWAVLKAVLTDTEAQNPVSVDNGHLKDPVLHVLNLGRALNAQVNDPNMFGYIFRNLGQLVLSPTTVFSFYSPMAPLPGHPGMLGPEFQIYSPGLAIQRANFIFDILYGQMGSSFVVNLAPFVAVAGDSAALVEKVSQTLFFGQMSNELRQALITLTNATPYANDRALGALYLAAISSEYSVQR